MRIAVRVLGSFLLATPSVAERVSDARLSWSAFECATFASFAGDEAEQHRLFQLGYDAGHRYVEALQAGRISNDEIQNDVPIGFSLSMNGPSTDFALGQVFAVASDDAVDKVTQQTNGSADHALRRTAGSILFHDANCSLLR
ncbi:MAG: hypothetical protein ABUS57_07460 [Pseudomonadota bacterium]